MFTIGKSPTKKYWHVKYQGKTVVGVYDTKAQAAEATREFNLAIVKMASEVKV